MKADKLIEKSLSYKKTSYYVFLSQPKLQKNVRKRGIQNCLARTRPTVVKAPKSSLI